MIYPVLQQQSVVSDKSLKTDLDNIVLQKRWLKYLDNMLVANGSVLIPLKSLAEFPFILPRSKIWGWILQALFNQN